MKIADLEFKSESCCGTCFAATVDLPDGRTLGIATREDGLYNLSYFTAAGLHSRENAVDEKSLADILAGL